MTPRRLLALLLCATLATFAASSSPPTPSLRHPLASTTTARQLSWWDDFKDMTKSAWDNISTQDIAGWAADQWAQVPVEKLGEFTKAQWEAVPFDKMITFTADQLKAIPVDQIKAFSKTQWEEVRKGGGRERFSGGA